MLNKFFTIVMSDKKKRRERKNKNEKLLVAKSRRSHDEVLGVRRG